MSKFNFFKAFKSTITESPITAVVFYSSIFSLCIFENYQRIKKETAEFKKILAENPGAKVVDVHQSFGRYPVWERHVVYPNKDEETPKGPAKTL